MSTAAASGSWANWFAQVVYPALRTTDEGATTIGVLDHPDDCAAVSHLLRACANIDLARKRSLIALMLAGRAAVVAASPTLSVLDVLDAVEHIQEQQLDTGGSSNVFVDMLQQDGTRADLRCVCSLLSLDAPSMRVLLSRVPTAPHTLSSPAASPTKKAVAPLPVTTPAATRSPEPPLKAARIDPLCAGPVRREGDGPQVGALALLWTVGNLTAAKAKYATELTPSSGSDPLPSQPFDPQHPQRVMESTPEKLVRRMLKDGCAEGFFADLKYDGERLLGFKTGTVYRFFSRNMLVVPERKLEPVRALLDAAFGPHDVVFDAEILSLFTFGSMNEVNKGDITLSGPRVYVFDLLWINGNSLVHRPLVERKEILACTLTPTKNVLMSKCFYIPKGASAEAQLQLVFDDAMSKRLEGYVLKPSRSTYRYNGTDWVKLKKGYMVGDEGPALPGGLAAAGAAAGPRIRRVDGIPMTAVVHAATRATHKLYCKLTDTLDCIGVGWAGKKLLCAVLDKSSGKYVTVGFAADNQGAVPLAAHRLAPPAVRKDFAVFAQVSCEVVSALEYAYCSLADCPVVEIAAEGLVESAAETCSVSVTCDAYVVRLREDKDASCTNTRQQVKALFSFAIPTLVSSDVASALISAVSRFNDQHWDALPAACAGKSTFLVRSDDTISGADAIAMPASTAGVLRALLVAVAPGKQWVDKGIMRDVSTRCGPEPSVVCNTSLAGCTSSAGDVVTTTLGRHKDCLCFVAGVVSVAGKGGGAVVQLESSAVLDIVVSRVFGMLLRLAPMYSGGAELHMDAVTCDDAASWTKACENVLSDLPEDARASLRVVLHRRRGRGESA